MRLPPLFEVVTDLRGAADRLRRRRFGVIQIRDGCLRSVRLRPWPARFTRGEVAWQQRYLHDRRAGDCCWLYYNQPWGSPDYLALQYVVSYRETTVRTLRTALDVLDEIARIKATAALVCQVTNGRLTDRMLRRAGWERHLSHSGGRHFIKRFSGETPQSDLSPGNALATIRPARNPAHAS